MNLRPFKRDGFDTLIGAGLTINGGLTVAPNTCTVIDGAVDGPSISMALSETEKLAPKTTLVVNGRAVTVKEIAVHNVTVTGEILCETLIVEGQLSIKAGSKITAREIKYRTLHIENGAVVLAHMTHLDHQSTPTGA